MAIKFYHIEIRKEHENIANRIFTSLNAFYHGSGTAKFEQKIVKGGKASYIKLNGPDQHHQRLKETLAGFQHLLKLRELQEGTPEHTRIKPHFLTVDEVIDTVVARQKPTEEVIVKAIPVGKSTPVEKVVKGIPVRTTNVIEPPKKPVEHTGIHGIFSLSDIGRLAGREGVIINAKDSIIMEPPTGDPVKDEKQTNNAISMFLVQQRKKFRRFGHDPKLISSELIDQKIEEALEDHHEFGSELGQEEINSIKMNTVVEALKALRASLGPDAFKEKD